MNRVLRRFDIITSHNGDSVPWTQSPNGYPMRLFWDLDAHHDIPPKRHCKPCFRQPIRTFEVGRKWFFHVNSYGGLKWVKSIDDWRSRKFAEWLPFGESKGKIRFERGFERGIQMGILERVRRKEEKKASAVIFNQAFHNLIFCNRGLGKQPSLEIVNMVVSECHLSSNQGQLEGGHQRIFSLCRFLAQI